MPEKTRKAAAYGRKEIQMAGSGGQGLALAGVILAEAAGIYEGKHVATIEVHGVNARGGPSRSDIIVSDEEIDYPAVRRPDILIAMTPRDVQTYGPSVRDDGIMVIDTTRVGFVPASKAKVIAIPLAKSARELGQELVVGIMALGVVSALTGAVSLEALERAVAERVPAKVLELNRQALQTGARLAKEAAEKVGT